MIHDTHADQGVPLGEEILVGNSRLYRYAKNGLKPLAAGTVLQGTRPNTSHDNLTCSAAGVGGTRIVVQLSSGDPMTVDEYKNGYIFINDQAGEGFVYDIVSNEGGGGEDATKNILIKDPLVVALTTSSQATLVKNIYDGVNRPFGDPWDIIVGVCPVTVPANEYFWCQVRGPVAVLQAGGLFAGRGVMLSQSKPGAVEVLKQVIPVREESFPAPYKETSGKATLLNSNTSITVTHGLGTTPLIENITITPGENPTGAIAEQLFVDTITSTQFNVNGTDPGASNLDFGWRAKAVAKSGRSGARQFQQKGIEKRLQGDTQRTAPDELLTEVAGKATIPERVIGYCINPRVSEEYALVYLTLS
jgi:hypothetical protein